MTPRGPEPRTTAGKALLTARPLVTETMSGRALRSPDKVLRKAILAIEAEAAAGTALDERLRRFAELVAETSNDPHLVAEAEHILEPHDGE